MEASLAPRRRTSPLSRELKSRGKRQGGSEGRAHFRGRVRWRAECVGCPEQRGRRYHVPDRPPPPQSPFWQTVDWEAPAAADRVFPREAEYDPSPGDRGGEPLLAEHALSYRGAGVRPRRGAQGGGLRGHQGGQHVQVPPRQICGRPARPSQCHQEVVLTRNHHLSVGRITGLPPLDPILEPKNCNLWGDIK